MRRQRVQTLVINEGLDSARIGQATKIKSSVVIAVASIPSR